MASIDDILKKAKPLVQSVRVCLDGELLGQREDLSRDLSAVPKADTAGRERIRRQMDDLETAIDDASASFTFKGRTMFDLDEWMTRHPTADGKGVDSVRGAAELIASCCVDPVMTVEQADELLRSINRGAGDQLFTAAYLACTRDQRVPFSGRASASTAATASK